MQSDADDAISTADTDADADATLMEEKHCTGSSFKRYNSVPLSVSPHPNFASPDADKDANFPAPMPFASAC